jgi:hypothetical protein
MKTQGMVAKSTTKSRREFPFQAFSSSLTLQSFFTPQNHREKSVETSLIIATEVEGDCQTQISGKRRQRSGDGLPLRSQGERRKTTLLIDAQAWASAEFTRGGSATRRLAALDHS